MQVVEDVSSPSEEVNDIGRKIRSRRRQLGLTLQYLGNGAGLSPAFLSQVERGLASPSVSSLVSIARALGVSTSFFLEPPESRSGVIRAPDEQFFTLDHSNIQYARLTAPITDRSLEPLLVIYPPDYVSESIKHTGEEFIYILTGKFRIKIGSEEYTLLPGDSAHFNSGSRHRWESLNHQEVRLLWVGTPPLF